MSQLLCCTCLQPCTADIAYYTLDSDPTASNDINLNEKLSYLVPEFQDILGADWENKWICSVCCQALCWGYCFRRMCLEVRDNLLANDGLSVKEETVDVDEGDLSLKREVDGNATREEFVEDDRGILNEIDEAEEAFKILLNSEKQTQYTIGDIIYLENDVENEERSEPNVVPGDSIKVELFGDEEDRCTYSWVEIIDPALLENQPDDVALIENACNTIPELKENNITPKQLQCCVRLESFDTNHLKQQIRRKRRHKRKMQRKPFRCDDCGKRYVNLFFLNCHQKSHSKKDDVPTETLSKQNHKDTKSSYYVDIITTKFRTLTLRRKFKVKGTQPAMPKLSPEPKRKRDKATEEKSMPVLFPSTQPEGNRSHDNTELLRKSVFNFEQNPPAPVVLSEQTPHKMFGNCMAPSLPASETTAIHPDVCFVAKDALEQSMSDYINFILKGNDPKATVPQPAAAAVNETATNRSSKKDKPPNNRKLRKLIGNTDHTYSLLSRRTVEKCPECSWTSHSPELFDLHIDNYHAAWWLSEETTAKIHCRIFYEDDPETDFEEERLGVEESVDLQEQMTRYVEKVGAAEQNPQDVLQIMEVPTVKVAELTVEPVEEVVGKPPASQNVFQEQKSLLRERLCQRQDIHTEVLQIGSNQLEKSVLDFPKNFVVGQQGANVVIHEDQILQFREKSVQLPNKPEHTVPVAAIQEDGKVIYKNPARCVGIFPGSEKLEKKTYAPQNPQTANQNTQNKFKIDQLAKSVSKEEAQRAKYFITKPLNQRKVVYMKAPPRKQPTTAFNSEVPKDLPSTHSQQKLVAPQENKIPQSVVQCPPLLLLGKPKKHAKPPTPQQNASNTVFVVVNPSEPNKVQFLTAPTGHSFAVVSPSTSKFESPPPETCVTNVKSQILVTNKTKANVPTAGSEKQIVKQPPKFVTKKVLLTQLPVGRAKKTAKQVLIKKEQLPPALGLTKPCATQTATKMALLKDSVVIYKARDGNATTCSTTSASGTNKNDNHSTTNSLKRPVDDRDDYNRRNKKLITNKEVIHLPGKVILPDVTIRSENDESDRLDNFEIDVYLPEEAEQSREAAAVSRPQSSGSDSKKLEEIALTSKPDKEGEKRVEQEPYRETNSSELQLRESNENDEISKDEMVDNTTEKPDEPEKIKKKRQIKRRFTIDQSYCKEIRAKLSNNGENKSAVMDETPQNTNTQQCLKERTFLRKRMRSVMEEAEINREVESEGQELEASENSYTPFSTIEEAIAGMNVTIPKWIPCRNQRRCKRCLLFCKTATRILHFDNYHIENERDTVNDAPSPDLCCNALIKLRGVEGGEEDSTDVDSMTCPTCKNTFNVEYYNKAHKHICGITVFEYKEQQTEREQELNSFVADDSTVFDTSCEDDSSWDRNKDIEKKSARKSKVVATPSKVTNNETPKNTEKRRRSVSRPRTPRKKSQLSKRQPELEQQMQLPVTIKIPSILEERLKQEKHESYVEKKNKMSDKSMTCPTCKNTFNVEYYNKAHKHMCGITVFEYKDQQAEREEELNSFDADDSIVFDTSCEDDSSWDRNKEIKKKSARKSKVVATLSKVTNNKTPKKRGRKRCQSVSRPRTLRSKSQLSKGQVELEQQIELPVAIKIPSILEERLKQEKPESYVERKNKMGDKSMTCPTCKNTFNVEYYNKAHKHMCGITVFEYKDQQAEREEELNSFDADDGIVFDTSCEDDSSWDRNKEIEKKSARKSKVVAAPSKMTNNETPKKRERKRRQSVSRPRTPCSKSQLSKRQPELEQQMELPVAIKIPSILEERLKQEKHESYVEKKDKLSDKSMICPTCKNTFNIEYYNEAHKHVCGITVFECKDQQTAREEELNSFDAGDSVVFDTSCEDDSSWDRNKEIEKKSARKSKVVAAPSKVANNETPKKRERKRRQTVSRPRTPRSKSQLSKRQPELEQQIELPVAIKIPSILEERPKQEKHESYVVRKNKMGDKSMTCPTCKSTFNVEYYNKAHKHMCGITVFEYKEQQTEREGELNSFDADDSTVFDTSCEDDSSWDRNKEIEKKSARKSKVVATPSKVTNNETPQMRGRKRRQSVSRPRTLRSKSQLSKRQPELEQQMELPVAIKIPLTLEERLKQEKHESYVEKKNKMSDKSMTCPACKNTFNIEYYNKTHKHTCGITVFEYKKQQTEREEELNCFDADDSIVFDTSCEDDNSWDRNKEIEKKSARKSKVIAAPSKVTNNETSKKRGRKRRQSVSRPRTLRSKSQLSKRQPELEQQMGLPVAIKIPLTLEERLKQEKHERYVEKKNKMSDKSMTCPTCKNTFNIEYYNKAHKHICGITGVFEFKEQQTEREEEFNSFDADDSTVFDTSCKDDSSWDKSKEVEKKSAWKTKVVATPSKVTNNETPKKRGRKRPRSVSRPRIPRSKSQLSKRQLELEQQMELSVAVKIPSILEERLEQERHGSYVEKKNEMSDKVHKKKGRSKKTEQKQTEEQRESVKEERGGKRRESTYSTRGKMRMEPEKENHSSGHVVPDTPDNTTQVLEQSMETEYAIDDAFDDVVLKLDDDEFVSDIKENVKGIIQSVDQKLGMPTQNLTHQQNEVIVDDMPASDAEDKCEAEMDMSLQGHSQHCELYYKPDSHHLDKNYNSAHKHTCGKTLDTFSEKCVSNLHSVEHEEEKPVEEVMKEVQDKIDETIEKMEYLKKYTCQKCEICFYSNDILKMHCLFKHGS